jgi:hypothetical protein
MYSQSLSDQHKVFDYVIVLAPIDRVSPLSTFKHVQYYSVASKPNVLSTASKVPIVLKPENEPSCQLPSAPCQPNYNLLKRQAATSGQVSLTQ